MNFELGKKYIVNVTEKGIIPLREFDYNKWYHIDYADLLKDEEKKIIVNEVLDEIKADIEAVIQEETVVDQSGGEYEHVVSKLDPDDVLQIIYKYKRETQER